MPPRDLWLIRHGQSTSNAGSATVGQADVPLTPLGIEQARQIARSIDQPPGRIVVSPFERARATAEPLRARWPVIPTETWQIQEITYLSPSRCVGSTAEIRQPWIDAFWLRCDPFYRDGPDAETFAEFLSRVEAFHRQIISCDDDFVVAIGHGQFFRAFLIGLREKLKASPVFMDAYRRNESSGPLANGEIVRLTREQLAGPRAR